MYKTVVIIRKLKKEKECLQTGLVEHCSVSREMNSEFEKCIALSSVGTTKIIADVFGPSLGCILGEGILSPFEKPTLKRLHEIQDLKFLYSLVLIP